MNKMPIKKEMLRVSLDVKDKKLSSALFRTDEFRNPKVPEGNSLMVYRKVTWGLFSRGQNSKCCEELSVFEASLKSDNMK